MAETLIHTRLQAGSSSISRRDFVRGVGLAIAGSVLLPTGIERLGSQFTTWEAAPMLRATFAPYVGSTFHVWLDASDSIALQLFKVRDLLSARRLTALGYAIDPEQSFSILFRGPVDQPLLQDIYRLEHKHIGSFSLFVVPMRAERDGRYYEVIFNRLRSKE